MVRFLFDMDGTVTALETLPMVARRYGLVDKVEPLTAMAVRGEMPFEDSFLQRVQVLGRLPVDEVSNLIAHAPLHQLVADFIARHARQCAVVTSNLDCWCRSLIASLGCRAHCSTARVENNRVKTVTSVLCKQDVVDEYRHAGDRVVFIGDGHNDLAAMTHAHVAVAVGLLPGTPAPELSTVAHHVCSDEASLCRLLDSLADNHR